MKIPANLILPLPLGSHSPCQDPLKLLKIHRLMLRPATIGTVVTLITAAVVFLFNNNDAYLSKNGKLAIASLIYMLIVNLLIFCKPVSILVLLTLYAAAQVLTLPYCVLLILNIRRLIDGQFERQECVMAALVLVPDIIGLSLFIVSMCLGGGFGSSDGSSSGSSSGGSSGGSSSGCSS
ncbi:uncharacterized protein LOC116800982 [Drosophila sechellia]|uniref:uncharacterized protein LOC116800982 n=1 Tax=Drosophila sechellia TaxID=7238 RepID=UPI0013DD8B90|nr:uncharacterized protein LOC116800982 [Drosophila sechellia]